MSRQRRLVASLAASALAWVGLTVLVAVPAAHADVQPPHDPATYYAGTEGLTGTALATALHDIIDGNAALTYTPGVWEALKVLDADPNDSTKLIDFYSGDSLLKANQCGGSCDQNTSWNREHTWPQSHGVDLDAGVPAGTDLFHMRPSRPNSNSSRGDLDFDESVNPPGYTVPGCTSACARDTDSFEPREAIKGDLARGLFYMAVRYNGGGDGAEGDLVLVERIPSSGTTLGKLSTLVAWSLADPPDDRERWRNDKIDSDYQHNRNPFIDHPEWVCSVWGAQLGPGSVCSAGSNAAPTTSPMTKDTAEDTATTVTLTASDVDGDPLTWSVTAQAGHGTASVTSSTLSYTPAPDYHGTDVVGVTVSDGKGGTAVTTVTVTVTPVDDPPTANPVTTSTVEDTAKTLTLTAAEPDGDPLTYAIIGQPAHGSVSRAGNQATYTPAADYHGPDSFTWTASDGSTTVQSSAAITVSSVNDVPVAVDREGQTTPEDTAKTIGLPAADADGDPLTRSIATQPQHGSVSVNGSVATYTPHANYSGADSFTFTASDATATSLPATVSVTVTPVADAPVATPATVTTAEDTARTLTLTGTDSDGDPLVYAITGQPAHGSVALVGAQATYTPAPDFHGPDSFTWSVSDGTTSTETSTSVTVTPVNDAPSVSSTSLRTTAGAPVSATLRTSDPDGDPVVISAVTAPANGSVSFSGTTMTLTPSRAGTDAFVVTVSDGNGGTATTQVGVEVARSAPRLSIAAKGLNRGGAGVVKVKVVPVAGTAATGRIRLTLGAKKLTGKLVHGVATFKLARLPDTAKLKATARYAGDSQYLPGSAKRTFKLKDHDEPASAAMENSRVLRGFSV